MNLNKVAFTTSCIGLVLTAGATTGIVYITGPRLTNKSLEAAKKAGADVESLKVLANTAKKHNLLTCGDGRFFSNCTADTYRSVTGCMIGSEKKFSYEQCHKAFTDMMQEQLGKALNYSKKVANKGKKNIRLR